eukprot:5967155-Prymnesium_polylepis.1
MWNTAVRHAQIGHCARRHLSLRQPLNGRGREAPAQVALLVEVLRLEHRPDGRLLLIKVNILGPPDAHSTPIEQRAAGWRALVRCTVGHLLDGACAPDVVALALARLWVGDPVAPAHIDVPINKPRIERGRFLVRRLRILY